MPPVAASTPVAALAPVAALPMYDWPKVRLANDVLWRRLAAGLRTRGLDAPEQLERNRPDTEIWRDPGLLIAQTCGYPFVAGLLDHLRLVATPCYGVAGCEGACYSSHIIVRCDEEATSLAGMAGRNAAINGINSQSGFAALQAAVSAEAGPTPYFASAIISGSHFGSMRAVAAGEADIAAIDAVCWALAQRDCPQVASHLKSIATTPLTPGLPFVTAIARPDIETVQIRDALAECFADPQTEAARRALFLTGFEILGIQDYLAAFSRIGDNGFAMLIPPGPKAVDPADKSKAAHNHSW